MNETLILTQVLAGIVGGLVYVLLALGLTLIFGFMGVVNFAHGSFYMVGAYVGLVVATRLGVGFWSALIAVPILVALLGAVVERSLIRPLYGRKEYDPLLLTFGLTFVLIEVVKFFFGKIGLAFNAPAGINDALIAGQFIFPKYQVFLALAAIAIIRALWIDFDRTRALVFALGIGLAGLAGVLHAPTRELSADMGLLMIVFAFVTVVVGGMGSYWGAVAGGLLIGVVYSL